MSTPSDSPNELRDLLQQLSDGTLSPEASRITAPMAEPDRVTDLLLALRQSGIGLDEISVQKPTLDEVFLTLTGHDAADQNQPEAQNAEGEKEEVLA